MSKTFSSANQPVCVGSSSVTSPGRHAMNESPADASRYLTVPPTTTSATLGASTGSAPTAWYASTSMSAPCSRAIP